MKMLALIAAGLLFIQRHAKKVKTLTVVNMLFFGLAAVGSWMMPNVSVLEYSQLAVYIILACTTLLSLTAEEPFTMQYAKETTPEAIWSHPLFQRINRILTVMWALLFSLGALFAGLTVSGMLNHTAGLLLANSWCVLGFIANLLLPPYMQRRYAEKLRGPKRPELEWEPTVLPAAPAQGGHYDVIVIVIPETFEAWRDSLIERFPEERGSIRGLFAELATCFAQMRTVFAPDRLTPYIPHTMEEMNRFAQENPNYLRWQGRTWKELLTTYTANQDIHRELSFLAGYVGDAGEETQADSMIPLMGYFSSDRAAARRRWPMPSLRVFASVGERCSFRRTYRQL